MAFDNTGIIWTTTQINHTLCSLFRICNEEPSIDTTAKEFEALQDVSCNPGLSLNELAASRQVTKGAMSQLISKLAARGLVNKEPSEESASRICLVLTDEGNRLLDDMNSELNKREAKVVEMLSSSLSDEEIEVFRKGLGVLHDELKATLCEKVSSKN